MLVLRYVKISDKPKTFRFQLFVGNGGVTTLYGDLVVRGIYGEGLGLCLWTKIGSLKHKVEMWSIANFGKLEKRINLLEEALEKLETKEEPHNIFDSEREQKEKDFKEWKDALRDDMYWAPTAQPNHIT